MLTDTKASSTLDNQNALTNRQNERVRVRGEREGKRGERTGERVKGESRILRELTGASYNYFMEEFWK